MVWNAGLIEAKGNVYMREKARSGLADERVKPAGIAQRYGPVWVVRQEYDRPGLAVRPAVWSALADLTAGMAEVAIAAASSRGRYSG